MIIQERIFGAASFPALPLPCVHYWDLEEVGRKVSGKCRHCGQTRTFSNTGIGGTETFIRGNQAQRARRAKAAELEAKAAESEPMEHWENFDGGVRDYDEEGPLDGTAEV